MVNDTFGNYLAINYEDGKIVNVNNGKQFVNFEYDSNNRLERLTDSRGKTVQYVYNSLDSGTIATVKYFNNTEDETPYKTIKFSYTFKNVNCIYSLRLSSVEASDNLMCDLEYDTSIFDGRITSIKTSSVTNKIPDGAPLKTEIDKCDIEYQSNRYISGSTYPYVTTIRDEYENESIYAFDINGSLKAYFETKNGLVSKAERISYSAYNFVTKQCTERSLLNKHTIEKFFSEYNGKKTHTTLNPLNLPVKVEETNDYIKEDTLKSVNTIYTYDTKYLQCTKEVKTVEYYTKGTLNKWELGLRYTYRTDYTYDKYREVLEKKTIHFLRYSKDNKSKEDIKEKCTVEQYLYDSKGNLTETRKYNIDWSKNEDRLSHSFDSACNCEATSDTDIFYENKNYNDDGQIISEKDCTGMFTTTMEYYDGTNLLKKINFPDNGSQSFTYDSNDRIIKTESTVKDKVNSNTFAYSSDEVIQVNHSGNNAINLEYDNKRRISKVKIKDSVYETYEYEENVSENGTYVDKVTLTNANGEVFKAVTDRKGSFEKLYYGSELLLQKNYNANGELTSENLDWFDIDRLYDNYGNLISYKDHSKNYTEAYAYNVRGNISSITSTGVDRTTTFTYNDYADDSIKEINTGDFKIEPTYDINGRYTGKNVYIAKSLIDNVEITYLKINGRATTLPKEIKYSQKKASSLNAIKIKSTYAYNYNSCGNISTVTADGEVLAKYEYDNLGRLTKESNKKFNKTYLFTYDNNGNILSKETRDYDSFYEGNVKIYTYDGDRMTSFWGSNCTYDNVGNPTIYCGKTAVWEKGRKLVNFNGNTFEYDGKGRRTSKNNTTFTYDSYDRLIRSYKSANNGVPDDNDDLQFFYDDTGLVGFSINKFAFTKKIAINYYYRKDIQGNIIAILDKNGKPVVEYYYDAWGNCLYEGDSTLAELNPFRYRSYYFDIETGFYFLKTRYYDPKTGRFISPDDISYLDPEKIGGLNLYVYCLNNPVMYVDPTGHFPVLALILGITALVGLGLTIGGAASENNTSTAVGLTMVAIPALISGGMAIAAGIGGATLTGIVGGVTTVAGIGSGLFASAEYQEAFTGNNWILDTGMSESLYNGLMLTTATIATFGTFTSSFCYNFNIKSIDKIGKLIPSNHSNEGYWGIRFKNARGALRSLELQNHVPHGLHFQLNSWNPMHMSVKPIRRWTWFLTRM